VRRPVVGIRDRDALQRRTAVERTVSDGGAGGDYDRFQRLVFEKNIGRDPFERVRKHDRFQFFALAERFAIDLRHAVRDDEVDRVRRRLAQYRLGNAALENSGDAFIVEFEFFAVGISDLIPGPARRNRGFLLAFFGGDDDDIPVVVQFGFLGRNDVSILVQIDDVCP